MNDETKPPPPTYVVAHFPHPNALAQKGLADIAGIQVRYADDTPDVAKKAAQQHLHLLINWSKLRPHVVKSKVVSIKSKTKRRGRRKW